jgi:hypothetical protein
VARFPQKKAIVRTEVERIDGVTMASFEWIDEWLMRGGMGRVNGSRECAPDDELRDTRPLQFM